MEPFKYKHISSPVGCLKIVIKDEFLVAVLWGKEESKRVMLGPMTKEPRAALILETEKQLNEYFFEKRKIFNLPFITSGTSFQKEVWNFLSQIPYRLTCSYKQVAMEIKRPKAVRAVATAIGKNPLSIILPCHRVIASCGQLAGFAGGIEHKKFLLDLEASSFK